ncbi:MAG: GNAT family N-acetyltransferase [Clostridiales bacterium]|nr:GNAT family N-acetyltransferase [Clostridiales bacterium]
MLEFRFIYGENGYKLSKDMRDTVFGDELGMAVLSDDAEETAYHFIGYDKTVQIAAARLSELGETCFKIDFVAVKKDYRRQFVGDLVMRALADKAVSLGGTRIIAESPTEIKGFFEFEAYEAYGDEFEKDGRKYIMMKKDLTKVQPCRGCAK